MPAERREPVRIVTEGIEVVIERDLLMHKGLLAQTKLEIDSFRNSRAHEVKRKKHYRSLIGGGKYNDDSLRSSMGSIAVNIRHFDDKVKLFEEKMAHHTVIVDTLSEQLVAQRAGLDYLARYRKDHATDD